MAEEGWHPERLPEGLRFGDGAYETLRSWQGHFSTWPRHRRRLRRSLSAIGLRLDRSQAARLDREVAALAPTQGRDVVLRVVAAAVGQGVAVAAWSSPLPPPPSRPLSAISAPLRVPEGDPLARHKLLSAVRQRAARRSAEAAGADEAVLLDQRGHLVEAAHAALLVVTGRALLTPPLRCGALDSLSVRLLFSVAPRLGLAARRKTLLPAELGGSEAVLLVSSVRGVVALGSLDGEPLPDGSSWRERLEAERVAVCGTNLNSRYLPT